MRLNELHMGEYGKAEAVFDKRIEVTGCQIRCPVFTELLGTEHQHVGLAQLKIFDDRQSFEGLAEADAVRNDTTVVRLNLVDGADNAFALELKQELPDFRVFDVASPALYP